MSIEMFTQRINLLSPIQRKHLASQLKAHEQNTLQAAKRLAAYIVCKKDKKLNESEVKSFLSHTLPEYMMPTSIQIIDEMPKMPNGKVDKAKLMLLNDRESTSHSMEPAASEIEQDLCTIWEEVLQASKVGRHDNYYDIGGDSIASIRIVSRVVQLGYSINPKQLIQFPTVAELAKEITLSSPKNPEDEDDTGVFAITPSQSWVLQQNLPNLNRYCQTFVFSTALNLKPERLEAVFTALLEHHKELGVRFFFSEGVWQQKTSSISDKEQAEEITGPEQSSYFTYKTVSDFSLEEQKQHLLDTINQLQESINISEGPLIQGAYLETGNELENNLVLVAHHLIVDGISWQILLEDFQNAYHQLTNNAAVKLPPKSASYKNWSHCVGVYNESDKLQKEVEYWTNLPLEKCSGPPLDFPNNGNRNPDYKSVSITLDSANTNALLHDVASSFNVRINEVLVAALSLAYFRWQKQTTILLEMEFHGREDLDQEIELSRTIGRFTVAYPLILQTKQATNLAELIKSSKEQQRAVPRNGIGFSFLKYGGRDESAKTELEKLPEYSLKFNYLGHVDDNTAKEAFLAPADYDAYNTSHDMGQACPLELICSISKQCLNVELRYDQNVYKAESIEALNQYYEASLDDIIKHGQNPHSGSLTPSDFPDADIDQDDLDDFLSQINKTE